MNKVDTKAIFFRAPPKDDEQLSKFEKQLLSIVQELGEISFNELISRIDNKYKPLKENPSRWEATSYTWRYTMNMAKLLEPLKHLHQLGCLTVDTDKLKGV